VKTILLENIIIVIIRLLGISLNKRVCLRISLIKERSDNLKAGELIDLDVEGFVFNQIVNDEDYFLC